VLKTYTSPNCLKATAGQYLIFVNNDGTIPDGGLPWVDYRFNFALLNSGTSAGIFIGVNNTVLDALTYTATTDGVSSTLSVTHTDPAMNDTPPTNWCASMPAYGDGQNKGSPGMADPACP
jgi:hypothetical protein